MNDIVMLANEELKRADHLVYVSLKYTRTVDVIKSILERLINVYEVVINGVLEKAEEEMLIFEIPTIIKKRVETVLEIHSDDTMKDYLDFYMHLKKLDNASYSASGEFRKHVHMKATFANGESTEVYMDDLKEYFAKTKEFLEYVLSLHVIE